METEKNPIANMLNEIRDLGHDTDSQMAPILAVHRVTVNKMRFSCETYSNPRLSLYTKIAELYRQVKNCGEGVKNER